ncbi:MAG: anaerobic ribonucleoside-triphosphate reductase activating protein [Desulfobacterales bacterium]|nr:anaerobic ribonucleoside-triphosphate reductase activating protein [Desulfobacterales bacterium]
MNFGGIQKVSLIDYPGKISAVIFVSKCNFRCPYCHNGDLVKGLTKEISEVSILEYLDQSKSFLEAVTISGGEPTLYPDIEFFIEKIKKTGLLIKLDTNGSAPELLSNLKKQGLIDYIAMDFKTLPEYYEKLNAPNTVDANIKKSINIIMEGWNEYEFRTTCIKPFISLEIIKQMGKHIQNAKLWVIQKCHTTRILSPEFFQKEDRLFSNGEIEGFHEEALKFVRNSFIR